MAAPRQPLLQDAISVKQMQAAHGMHSPDVKPCCSDLYARVHVLTAHAHPCRLAARLNRLTTEADAQLNRSRARSAAATPAPAAADALDVPARALVPAEARGATSGPGRTAGVARRCVVCAAVLTSTCGTSDPARHACSCTCGALRCAWPGQTQREGPTKVRRAALMRLSGDWWQSSQAPHCCEGAGRCSQQPFCRRD